MFFNKSLTATRKTPVPVLLYIKLIKSMSSIHPLQGVLRTALTPRWCREDPWRDGDSRHLYLLWNYKPITQYLLYVGNPRQRLVFLLYFIGSLPSWKSHLDFKKKSWFSCCSDAQCTESGGFKVFSEIFKFFVVHVFYWTMGRLHDQNIVHVWDYHLHCKQSHSLLVICVLKWCKWHFIHLVHSKAFPNKVIYRAK